jgi:hypothetical protein
MKINARQQELLERYRDFLREAIVWALRENEDPYEVEIPKDNFLVKFGLRTGVGAYARERYYQEFITIGAFFEVENANLSSKLGVKTKFRLSFDDVEDLAKRYNLDCPKPKMKPQIPT